MLGACNYAKDSEQDQSAMLFPMIKKSVRAATNISWSPGNINAVLSHFLEPGERVEADNGYQGHMDKIKCP